MIVDTIAESIIGLFIEAAKEKFHEKLDEKRLKEKLIAYIEGQRKYNDMCSLAEEFDFQGLVEYISKNLISDVGVRVFNPNRKERCRARASIVKTAIARSKAKTNESKSRVAKCISICLDIIRNFYKEHHLTIKEYLLADEIVDAIAEKVDKSNNATISAIQATGSKILSRLENKGTLFSFDTAISLAEDGEIGTIGAGIKGVLDHISPEHPLYPYYGFDYQNGMMCSKPLTAEAAEHYPPGMRLSGTAWIGDRTCDDYKLDILDYSYRHQLPIHMEVADAIKLLGEKPDPIQDEAKELVGRTLVATPPEFPPAFPCAIKVGDTSFYDYVLFRTKEIEDDGSYVINNKEQDIPFHFEVKFHPERLGRPGFRIQYNGNATSKELLNHLRFLKTLSEEKDFCIYALSLKSDLLSCTIDTLDYVTGFANIEEEIDFWERVCDVEDYFNVSLSPKGKISGADYDLLIHLSELVRYNEVHSTWTEATCIITICQQFRDRMSTEEEEMHMLAMVGKITVKLFDAEIDIRMARIMKCARIVDFEKIKKKLEVLDDGEDIKITLHAGDDNDIYDTLNVPECQLVQE